MQATKSVKDPGKQRSRLFNAPAHKRHKLMSAHLAPELVKSHGARTLPVRKGDTVRIMRGDHEGFEGKVSTVDLKNYQIFLDGLTREKVDGTVIFISVHPSKVLIKSLNLNDKWRKRTIERKKALQKKEEPVVKKPAVKAAKPEAKEEKPAKEKAKPAEAKTKPIETKALPLEAKAEAVAKVKEEKAVEKKVKAVKAPVKKAEAKTEIPAIVEVAKKPAKKAHTAAKTAEKKPVAATRKKKETPKEQNPPEEPKPPAEEKPAEKKPKTPAKKTTTKKAPAKTKVEKEGGA